MVGMNEQIETQAVTVIEQQRSLTVFRTENPKEIVQRTAEMADALADFIKQRNLSVQIQGREHVLVEGWSFMGSMLGVFPRVVSIREIGEDDGYEAMVELVTKDGAIVGGGIAECSRDEQNWHDRATYALKSMAQTRAVSKAYRLTFGFVMAAAGYSATPAEEMQIQGGRRRAASKPPVARTDGPTRDPATIQNAGQLMSYATGELGYQDSRGVFSVLGVTSMSEVKDFQEAAEKLKAALEPKAEPVAAK